MNLLEFEILLSMTKITLGILSRENVNGEAQYLIRRLEAYLDDKNFLEGGEFENLHIHTKVS